MICQTSGVFGNSKYYAFDVRDCFKNAKYTGRIFKDSVRAGNQMKGQRIWRTIGLEDRQNNQTFNTSSGNCAQIGLFEVIKFGILEKKLNAFSGDDFNAVGKTRMTEAQVILQITFRDTNEINVFDADGVETKSVTIENRYYNNSDIKTYLMKEDWVVNSHTGKLEKKIVGIAPLVYERKSEKTMPLFWLYYNEWKELLASFEAKNYYTEEPLTYFDIFERRYFISQISKESNIFDRKVKMYKHGQELHLENEIIKNQLHNSEKDLFQH
jgi:gliding motility associated protien GldN